MKKVSISVITIFCFCLQLSAQVPTNAKNINKGVGGKPTSENLKFADPAVTNISFRVIKQNTGDRLQIKVEVKNIGLRNYESGANQQNIQLWEEYSATKRTLVKTYPFQNLNSGASISFMYERSAFKASDEFPPQYRAIIVYDPDILMDNNKNNDDPNSKNNELSKNPRQ
jgi:hypothetical protein